MREDDEQTPKERFENEEDEMQPEAELLRFEAKQDHHAGKGADARQKECESLIEDLEVRRLALILKDMHNEKGKDEKGLGNRESINARGENPALEKRCE